MADTNITFYSGSQDQYNGLASKDPNGIYFLSPNSGETIGSIYKGNVKYGASELAPASSSSLGGIKVSSDFDISADGTLSIYTPIAINSFTNSVPQNEIGSSVNSATFSWNLNKTPTKLTVTSGSTSQTLSNMAVSNSLVTFATPITTNTTFTLSAQDSRNNPVTRTSTINFYHKKYWGVSMVNSADSINNTFILGLSSSALASGRAGNITVNAGNGQYIYFAIPASWGTPDFSVSGFSGGFSLFKTFDLTNASGNVTSYSVFKSTNANLGNTTVVIK